MFSAVRSSGVGSLSLKLDQGVDIRVTTVDEALFLQANTAWTKERVRFDPNIDIRNKHGAQGRELLYGGLISESYMDSLGLREAAKWFELKFLFPYDEEHRPVQRIGSVDVEWKKKPGMMIGMA